MVKKSEKYNDILKKVGIALLLLSCLTLSSFGFLLILYAIIMFDPKVESNAFMLVFIIGGLLWFPLITLMSYGQAKAQESCLCTKIEDESKKVLTKEEKKKKFLSSLCLTVSWFSMYFGADFLCAVLITETVNVYYYYLSVFAMIPCFIYIIYGLRGMFE